MTAVGQNQKSHRLMAAALPFKDGYVALIPLKGCQTAAVLSLHWLFTRNTFFYINILQKLSKKANILVILNKMCLYC